MCDSHVWGVPFGLWASGFEEGTQRGEGGSLEQLRRWFCISFRLEARRQLLLPPVMAAMASAAATIPSFSSLKACLSPACASLPAAKAPMADAGFPKASLKTVGLAAAAAATVTMAASNALALEVLLGGNGGTLEFIPSDFTVAAGETVVFKNNAAFPHNVVFDEDEIPSGVDAEAISMSDVDLLNAPGETYSVTLKEKGSYTFYCTPHKSAGMVGKVTVN